MENNLVLLEAKKNKRVVIVSGLAGAGKTTAVHALEDAGYYCIDNLPVPILNYLVDKDNLDKIKFSHVALALDSRDFEVPFVLEVIVEKLRALCDVQILFLECSHQTVLTRFRETRRQHPLTTQNPMLALPDAVKLDGVMLAPIKKIANRVLDTSSLSRQNLKNFVYHAYAPMEQSADLLLSFVSFGFKYGVPTDLDTLFDVRCFENPFYLSHLKPLTGQDPEVKQFVLSRPHVGSFLHKVLDFMQDMYPLYKLEGKKYFAVGIGCTGGKHRSVVIAEELWDKCKSFFPYVSVEHRHILEEG